MWCPFFSSDEIRNVSTKNLIRCDGALCYINTKSLAGYIRRHLCQLALITIYWWEWLITSLKLASKQKKTWYWILTKQIYSKTSDAQSSNESNSGRFLCATRNYDNSRTLGCNGRSNVRLKIQQNCNKIQVYFKSHILYSVTVWKSAACRHFLQSQSAGKIKTNVTSSKNHSMTNT